MAMTIRDVLIDRADVVVSCGRRTLLGRIEIAGEHAGERYFAVYQKGRKKPLVETVCEDEAVRWLIGEK